MTEKIGRCGTCKHWRRYTDKSDITYHSNHLGTCSSDRFVYADKQKEPYDCLGYWDQEDYSAGFNTGENFGCVHWAAVDAATSS